MSKETYEWLATNVLAGFSATRKPWWAKGDEKNLYPGAVPMADVHQLIASWTPYETALLDEQDVVNAITAGTGDYISRDALLAELAKARINSHKLVKASDNSARVGVVGAESAIHNYRDWLSGTVTEIVADNELKVSAAGLLRDRAQAWVTIERPESSTGPGGIVFSNFVTLSTSLDASLASQINQNNRLPICDNTLDIARGQGLSSRIKHSSRSGGKLGQHRGVLAAIMAGQTDFTAELERELAVTVDDTQFVRFLESFIPISEDDKPAKKTRSERKRQEITQLYKSDPRVTEWKGTEFGVVQAVNTWDQHMSQLRNATGYELDDTNLRAMRNYAAQLKTVKGDSSDESTIKVLEAVL
jgi:phage/plasmid-like protein (TIGR03299 family)